MRSLIERESRQVENMAIEVHGCVAKKEQKVYAINSMLTCNYINGRYFTNLCNIRCTYAYQKWLEKKTFLCWYYTVFMLKCFMKNLKREKNKVLSLKIKKKIKFQKY